MEKLFCSYCFKPFKRNDALQVHVKYQHNNQEQIPKYECHLCGTLSAYKSNAKIHLKNFHKMTDKQIEKTTIPTCLVPNDSKYIIVFVCN